ncbi:MAG: hypothetical protein WC549_05705 [Actinomycetota bacterium]
MKLNEEQKITVSDKLSFLKKSPCFICKSNNWIISDKIFEIREFLGGALQVSGDTSILPLISVTCSKCGNVIFFNALTLGVDLGSK